MLLKPGTYQRDRAVFKKTEQTNPASPNVQKPKSGIEISADEMEVLYSLVGRDCPVTIR
jgi:hypothetical protein